MHARFICLCRTQSTHSKDLKTLLAEIVENVYKQKVIKKCALIIDMLVLWASVYGKQTVLRLFEVVNLNMKFEFLAE